LQDSRGKLLGREGTGFITAMKFSIIPPMVALKPLASRVPFEALCAIPKNSAICKPISSFQAIQLSWNMATQSSCPGTGVSDSQDGDAGIRNYARKRDVQIHASDVA
jgi:hypothetical protein